jgi:FkbM family methyltransferase
MRGSNFLLGRAKRAQQSMRTGWQSPGSRRERVRLAGTLGRLHFLAATNRVFAVRPPVKALDLAFYFGSYDQFVYTFDEVFAKAPYAVMLPESRPRIVDCGANLGLSVLYFKSRFPDAMILAFEPDEQNYELLTRNIRANALTGITCHQVALGAEEGNAVFHTHPSTVGSALGTVGTARARPYLTKTQTVSVTRLSSYIHEPVDLLKLDVEGSEGAVLTDLANNGKLEVVRRMIIEYHHHLGVEQLSLAETLTVIEDAHFDVQIATPNHSSPRDGSYFQDVLIYAYRPSEGWG